MTAPDLYRPVLCVCRDDEFGHRIRMVGGRVERGSCKQCSCPGFEPTEDTGEPTPLPPSAGQQPAPRVGHALPGNHALGGVKPCANAAKHTPRPDGIPAQIAWADRMADTHEQTQCDTCGQWAIWVPKPPAAELPPTPAPKPKPPRGATKPKPTTREEPATVPATREPQPQEEPERPAPDEPIVTRTDYYCAHCGHLGAIPVVVTIRRATPDATN